MKGGDVVPTFPEFPDGEIIFLKMISWRPADGFEKGTCVECCPSTAFSMIPAWISDGREGKGPRAMSLVVKAWSQPIRPISKGGDVEKGGHVVRRSQKVGTSFGTPKRWGRRHKVGTSIDVPTFFSDAKRWGRRQKVGTS